MVACWEFRERELRAAVAQPHPLPDPDNARRLARELVAEGCDPTPAGLDAAGFPHACGRLGLDPDAAALLVAGLMAECPSGGGEAFGRATGWADANWPRFLVPVGCPRPAAKAAGLWRRRARVAALSFVLGRAPHRGGWALVPVEPVGRWLVVGRESAGDVIRWLAKGGVLEFRVRADGRTHSYRGREAREVKYVGELPGPGARKG